MSKFTSKNPIQIESPREYESSIIDPESENPIQEELATSDSTHETLNQGEPPPSENPILIPGNTFIEPGSVGGTLERVKGAVELARFVAGEYWSGHACCVPDDVHQGIFFMLLGASEALEYSADLLEFKENTKPKPSVSQISA